MAVPGQLARQRRLQTLSDAARSDHAFRLGVGYEFEQRPDGLPGLLKLYPLKLAGAPHSMDLGLLYKAIEQGQVDMVAGNSTDGQIAAMALTVLEDDRNYFPPYRAAVLVRNALNNTAVPRCLSQLSGRISLEAIRDANRRMEAGSQEAREIARRILEALTQSEGEASAPLPQMNNGH
jgi:osmoprotectant transport system substrate-binding protein